MIYGGDLSLPQYTTSTDLSESIKKEHRSYTSYTMRKTYKYILKDEAG